MIVVERAGTVLRCTGSWARYRLSASLSLFAAIPHRGFTEYHELCALAPDVQSARAVIRDRRRKAFYAQAQHRAKYFMASAAQGRSAEERKR
jgi:hypothetical protein